MISDVRSTGVQLGFPCNVDTVVSLSFLFLASTDGDSYLLSLFPIICSPLLISGLSSSFFLIEGSDLSRPSFLGSRYHHELFLLLSCLWSSLTQSAHEASTFSWLYHKGWLNFGAVACPSHLLRHRLWSYDDTYFIPKVIVIKSNDQMIKWWLYITKATQFIFLSTKFFRNTIKVFKHWPHLLKVLL